MTLPENALTVELSLLRLSINSWSYLFMKHNKIPFFEVVGVARVSPKGRNSG